MSHESNQRGIATDTAAGAEASFSTEYYRTCHLVLAQAEKIQVDTGDGSKDGQAAADLVNQQMAWAKRQICTHMTDWLYDNGGVIDQWPHPASGDSIAYEMKNDPGLRQAAFSYWGAPYVFDESQGMLLRTQAGLDDSDFIQYVETPLIWPKKPEKPMDEEEAQRRRGLRFKAFYDQARENAREELPKAREALKNAREEAVEWRSSEEIELDMAEYALARAQKRQRLPVRYILLLLLVLFTLPGYVFAIAGETPAFLRDLLTTHAGGGIEQYLMLPLLIWEIPLMVVGFISMLGADGMVARVVVSLLLLAIELFFAGYGASMIAASTRVTPKAWWESMSNRPARIRAAKKRLAEAKQAFAATTEEYRAEIAEQAQLKKNQQIREAEARVHELEQIRSDTDNMQLWRRRYEAYTSSEEYREEERADAMAREAYERELAAYEKAFAAYQEAVRANTFKKELCQQWQASWYEALRAQGMMADGSR